MGNARVSPSISHSTEKCNKNPLHGVNWEIGTHTFPIVWVLFPHTIPILWYISGNAWDSPSIFHSTEKCNKRTWELGTPTFPIVWAVFFH